MKKIANLLFEIMKRLKLWRLKSWNTSPTFNSLEMPVMVFFKAIAYKDYSDIKNFDDLYTLFNELMGGEDFMRDVEKQIDAELLSSKILAASALMNALIVAPTEALFNAMQKFDYPSSITVYDENNVLEYIEQIKPHVNSDVIDLQIMANRMKRDEKEQPQLEAEQVYFKMIEQVPAMSKAMDMHIPLSISVFEYCAYVNLAKRLNNKKPISDD